MDLIKFCRTVTAVALMSTVLIGYAGHASGTAAPNADSDMPVTTGPTSGTLVVAGGNIQDAAIIDQFIALAGGPGEPIVVVPTALEGDVDDLEWDYLEPFRDAGATNMTVLHTRVECGIVNNEETRH